ncbi:MAG: hypothetical protein KF713_02765 [Turneriella sp.]|nr:hypothetical protein [Turneriella sp.]
MRAAISMLALMMIFFSAPQTVLSQDISDTDKSVESGAEPNITDGDPDQSPDMKLMTSILAETESLKLSHEDSVALQAKKKRQLKNKTAEIITKNTGRSIKFMALQVWEVEPEQELTEYGRKRAESILQKMKKDPQGRALIDAMGGDLKENYFLRFIVAAQMASCKKCMRNTGRFEATFFLPSEGSHSHNIVKIVNSENAALKYVKGTEYPISGEITFIKIDENAIAKIVLK